LAISVFGRLRTARSSRAARNRRTSSSNDGRAGAAGWEFIGSTMIDRDAIAARMDPFKDVFELGYQPF
jgi:hypothetical protein